MPEKRTMMAQLASVSEGALGRLAQSDLSKATLQGALMLKDRVERLMGSMTDLDERVSELEKRVAALEKPKRTTTRKPSASKSTASAAKKTATAPKSAASSTKRSTAS
jgi:hypothetical protein